MAEKSVDLVDHRYPPPPPRRSLPSSPATAAASLYPHPNCSLLPSTPHSSGRAQGRQWGRWGRRRCCPIPPAFSDLAAPSSGTPDPAARPAKEEVDQILFFFFLFFWEFLDWICFRKLRFLLFVWLDFFYVLIFFPFSDYEDAKNAIGFRDDGCDGRNGRKHGTNVYWLRMDEVKRTLQLRTGRGRTRSY